MNLNTVVIVGDRFDPAMFSPEEFFGGAVDADRIVVGPMAQFSYNSRRCGFALNPSRIDLLEHSAAIMPEELQSTAQQVVRYLEKIRPAVEINGFGFNCDTTFETASRTGDEICNSLAQMPLLEEIAANSELQGLTQFKYTRGELVYSVRIEPEVQSQGKNLYVAVNGHQAVAEADKLEMKLKHSLDFRQYVGGLHERIRSTLL